MIVLDASALLDSLLETESTAEILSYLADPGMPVIAPDHMFVETLRTLQRMTLNGVIDEQRADAEMANAIGLDVTTYPCADLLGRAWSMRHWLTIDDGVYVALVESVEGASLLTSDRGLARAVEDRIPVIAV